MKHLIAISLSLLALCQLTHADKVTLKGDFVTDVDKTIEWMVSSKHRTILKKGNTEKMRKAMSVGEPLTHQWNDGQLKSIITEDWIKNHTRKWTKIDELTYTSSEPKDESNTEIVYTINIQNKDNYYIEIKVNGKTPREYFVRKIQKQKMENKMLR